MTLPCEGCGTPVEQTTGKRRRKWCSQRCRRSTLYGGTCVDCGAATCGNVGPNVTSYERCQPCARKARKKVWSRETIVSAIRAWAAEFGEPPAVPDWQPSRARQLNDEARVQRFEERRGDFPTHMTVFREFGSWNAAIVSAGFEPRANHGGSGNGARRRSVRERVAA